MLLAVASGSLAFAAAGHSSRARLIVLHTSDISGRVHPHDPRADRDFGQGLARISTALKGIRTEGPVLLLDSGDTINGSPTQVLAFDGIVGDGRDPMVKAMNVLPYDAMAIGNHEFDYGLARLETSRREAKFPWLAANVERQDGKPAFDPYIVREFGGVRVGILGLVTAQVPYWLGPRVAALRFRDTVETTRRFVPVLRGKERCDVEVFTVALNSYRASGGGGYAVWRDCPRVSESGRGLREILIEDARRRRELSLEPNRNWFLALHLPESRFRPPA